jgi:hypothetical protein
METNLMQIYSSEKSMVEHHLVSRHTSPSRSMKKPLISFIFHYPIVGIQQDVFFCDFQIPFFGQPFSDTEISSVGY